MIHSKTSWKLLFFALSLSACNSGGGGGSTAAPATPVPPVSSVQVASTFPQNGAVQVPLDTTVSVQFSGVVDPSSVQPYSFALYLGLGGVNQVAGSVTSDGNSATFHPAAPLKSLAAYRAVLTTQIVDASGLPLAGEFAWTFWTQDIQAPFVTSTLPLAQETYLPLGTSVFASFSEQISSSSVTPASFFLTGPGGALVPANVSVQDGSAVLDPQAGLAENTWYTASLTNAVKDLQGNSLTPYSWAFLSTEFTAPTILSTYPANLEENVPFQNTVVQVFFSESIDPLSVNDSVFRMTSPTAEIAGALSVDGAVLSFDPTLDFESETTYTVEILPGITDLAGNPFVGPFSWSFKSEIKVLGNPIPVPGSETGATPVVAMNELGDSAMILTKISGGLKDVYGTFYSTVGGWSPLVAIENHANNAVGLQLAVDGAGNAFAAWTQFQTATKQKARVNIFSPGAGPPPESILLGAESTLDPTPKIGVDSSGKGYVIWKEKVSGGKANLYWSTATLSVAWSAPALLETDDTGDVKAIDLYIAPDGTGCAVWAQDVSGSQNIYASRFNGVTWSSPPELVETDDAGIAKEPLVRGDGAGSFCAVWLQKIDVDLNGSIANDKFSLFGSSFVVGPGGGAWDIAPTPLEFDDTLEPKNHTLAMDTAGNAHVAWIQSLPADLGSESVYSNHLSVSGGGWTGIRLVEQAPDIVATPRIMCPDQNKATIVWIQNENIFYQTAFTANLNLPAATWSVAVPLEAVLSFASDTNVATDGKGKKLATWTMDGLVYANFFP